MACLASSKDALTPTNTIAEKTRVPASYLAKVLQMLSSGDLITGRRGVGGGYRLARPAGEITLLDILGAVDPRCTEHEGLAPGAELADLRHALEHSLQLAIDRFGEIKLSEVALRAPIAENAG